MEIDLTVWARRTSASPAWVVRHARQRIDGLRGRVAAVGISLESGFDPGRLTAREETALLSAATQLLSFSPDGRFLIRCAKREKAGATEYVIG